MNRSVEYPVSQMCCERGACSIFYLYQHRLIVTYSWFSWLLLCYYDSVGELVDLFGMVISVGSSGNLTRRSTSRRWSMWCEITAQIQSVHSYDNTPRSTYRLQIAAAEIADLFLLFITCKEWSANYLLPHLRPNSSTFTVHLAWMGVNMLSISLKED